MNGLFVKCGRIFHELKDCIGSIQRGGAELNGNSAILKRSINTHANAHCLCIPITFRRIYHHQSILNILMLQCPLLENGCDDKELADSNENSL